MKKQEKSCGKQFLADRILLIPVLVCSCLLMGGCFNSRSDDVPPSGASKILYMRRSLSSGKFEPYVLDDKEAIKRLRGAIHEDVLHASILPDDIHMSASSMHELLFYDTGNTLIFRCTILGDDYLVISGSRYKVKKSTMKCLEDLFKTKFRPVDSKAAIKDYREIGEYVNVMETGTNDESDAQKTKSESPEPVISDSKS